MKILKKLWYTTFLLLIWICWAQLEIPWQATIFNDNQDQYINANNISNPIRDWAYTAIKSPEWTWISWVWWADDSDQKIEDHLTAKTKTLDIIKNLINYALGLLSLVALAYMIYHGIIILTAAGDDTKYKEWLKWVKYAAIALIWVWLSRIFVSSIFRLIFNVLLAP